jgi:arylsulfatase A-like enzyme
MRALIVVTLIAGGCARSTASPPAPGDAPAPAARLPGDAIAFRFVEHAGEAQVTGALDEAWRALAYPAKVLRPYGGLRGAAAFRVVELALADADVKTYGQPGHAHQTSAARYDPVWNRTRAVYESKSALFAPSPSRYRFSVPPIAGGVLRLAIAIAPGSDEAEFVVEADGRRVWARAIPRSESGSWIAEEIPVDSAREIVLATTGKGVGFWGYPVLIERDAGAAGANVIVVIIDTLRSDALAVMPRLQQLAERGLRCDQAITAATWTRPSLIAMLGGDLPTTIGQSAEEMIPADRERRRFYAVSPPLLPRLLASDGYLARAIGNNFFLLGYPQIGLDLGFDEVDDIRHPVLDTPAITAAAIAFLEAHAREPFLLQLHYDAPHWPYTPPPEYLARVTPPPGFPEDALARAYLAEAAYADEYLGRVVDALARLHLEERTLLVVLGDHGEIFDHAHSHTVEALHQPTLHHHGWSAYDEILRVPLVMAMPGTVPTARVTAQVSLVDVEPTILDVLGRPLRPGTRGRSLLPLARGVTESERVAFVEGQDVRAVRAGGWLYLRRSDGRLTRDDGTRVTVDEELYDLARDPLQHHDLARAGDPQLQQMRTLFARELPTAPVAPEPVLHLQIAPDVRPHIIEGTLRTDGTVSIRNAAGAEVTPLDAHTLALRLRDAALVEVVIDPPTAQVALTLTRDGMPIAPSEVLVGGFGLPLLAGARALVLDGERVTWLDAARAPVPGERGEVLLWRDPSTVTALPAVSARNNQEVGDMMRRWGYAQPGK